MTLSDIIVSALEQLDRKPDPQNIAVWKGRMTRFANDAVMDLAHHLKLKRVDVAVVEGGMLDTATLPEQCVRVLSVWRDGRRVLIHSYDGSLVGVNCPDGDVNVVYRWVPKPMTNDTDVPAIPEHAHGLIVSYVVGRERATSDPSMQRGGNIYFELYNEGKRNLRPHLGERDNYELRNKWC